MNRKLVLAAGIVLAVLIGAAYLGRALEMGSRARFPSSFAPEPEGLLAFRRLLEGLGRPVEVRTRPWDELRSERASGLLLVSTPLQRGVDDKEAQALRSWLVRGGALLVIDDATGSERPWPLDRLLDEAGLMCDPLVPEPDPRTLMPARPKTLAAHGTAAVPAGKDLKRLSLHAEGGLRDEAPGLPLALGPSGLIVAAEGGLGAGRIVRVAGPLVANDRLLQGDNLTFALRLVEDLRSGGTIRFDEYHHGFGGLLPAIRGLDSAALAWAGLQALCVTILYAAARGVRFGPSQPTSEPLRRSSLEFVRSMASLYGRGRSRRHVIEALLQHFCREARGRCGLAEGASTDEIARVLSVRMRADAARVAAVLNAAQEALFRKTLTDREMLARARELSRLEEEVFGVNG